MSSAARFAGLFAVVDVAGSERMFAVRVCAAQDSAVGPRCAVRPPVAVGWRWRSVARPLRLPDSAVSIDAVARLVVAVAG